MCDYSLEQTASRPARVGDRLVSTAFATSITRGFADVDNANMAVCLLPGTELAFDREVECDRAIGLLPTRKIGKNLARFRKINPDRPHEHHDALEFSDGHIVLLTCLCPGQHATVLQLPLCPETAPTEEQPISAMQPVALR